MSRAIAGEVAALADDFSPDETPKTHGRMRSNAAVLSSGSSAKDKSDTASRIRPGPFWSAEGDVAATGNGVSGPLPEMIKKLTQCLGRFDNLGVL